MIKLFKRFWAWLKESWVSMKASYKEYQETSDGNCDHVDIKVNDVFFVGAYHNECIKCGRIGL